MTKHNESEAPQVIWQFRREDGNLYTVLGVRRPVEPGEEYRLFRQNGKLAHTGQGEHYIEYAPIEYSIHTNEQDIHIPTMMDGKGLYRAMYVVPVEGTEVILTDLDGNPIAEPDEEDEEE